MIAKRYAALSLIPFGMLLLSFVALIAPGPFRGPLMIAQPFQVTLLTGFLFPMQPVYLADAVGLVLLALAALGVWIIAITWEYRRQWRS
jgi:uncharacterized membrane protein